MKFSNRCTLCEHIYDELIPAKQGRFQLLLLRVVRSDGGDESARRNEVSFQERLLRGRAGNDYITLLYGCLKIRDNINLNSEFLSRVFGEPLRLCRITIPGPRRFYGKHCFERAK